MSEPTARWTVPMSDGNHVVEFEHGTATGKRVVKVDDNVLVHRDWMFRLVGDEVFMFNNTKFVIRVDPMPGRLILIFIFATINFLLFYSMIISHIGLKYSYSLWVNGKSYKQFVQSQSKILETWLAKVEGEEYRIVLGESWKYFLYYICYLKHFIKILFSIFMLLIDKQAHSVWVNGKEVEVEVEK